MQGVQQVQSTKMVEAKNASLCLVLKSIAFKALKKNLNEQQSLGNLAEALLVSEINHLSSLEHMQNELAEGIRLLQEASILRAQKCTEIFDMSSESSWTRMKEISRSLKDKLTQLIAEGKQSQLLPRMTGLIEGFQIYKEQYIKINRVLTHLQVIDGCVTKQLLDPCVLRNSTPQIGRTRMDLGSGSEIMEDEQISTKHSHYYRVESSANTEELLIAVRQIRKCICRPLEKLSEFIQLITKYIGIKNRDRMGSGEMMFIDKLSVVLTKIINNQYQIVDDRQMEMANWMMYNFPLLFLQRVGLSAQRHSLPNLEQSDSPYILQFSAFTTGYMNIPCELYLIRSSLIIIERTTSEGKKKEKPVNKLAVVNIDYTTRVSIVSKQMLDGMVVAYLSGGIDSCGVFLQFRAPEISSYFNLHKSACNATEGDCALCQRGIMKQWQESVCVSNFKIFKTVIQLLVSYHSFIYACRSRDMPICLCPALRHRYEGVYNYNKENEMINSKNKLLALRILNIEHVSHLAFQDQEKQYVVELTVFRFGREPSFHRKYRGEYMHINCQSASQIVQLRERELFQLEELIQVLNPQLSALWVQYPSLMPFAQSLALFGSSCLEQEEINQIQCKIITEYFNTFFKLQCFRINPQIILTKLKLSEGMWSLLIDGFKKNAQMISIEGELFYRADYPCECTQCQTDGLTTKLAFQPLYSQLGGLPAVMEQFEYWGYYNLLLSYPYSQKYEGEISYLAIPYQKGKKKQAMSKAENIMQINKHRVFRIEKAITRYVTGIKQTKIPYCAEHGYAIERKYIHWVEEQEKGQEWVQKLQTNEAKVLASLNRIKNVQYLCCNYSAWVPSQYLIHHPFELSKWLTKTQKLYTVPILLYCLPSLYDYYDQLPTQGESNQFSIFSQISSCGREVNRAQNHGFVLKQLSNVEKDTTCKHLKYMIGRMLGLDEKFIMHFMENFEVMIVQLEIKAKQSLLKYSINKLLSRKTEEVKREYRVKQHYSLYDHERIQQHLDQLLSQIGKYYISIRKLLKFVQPMRAPTKPLEKLPENHRILLDLQLAELCYKLNHDQLIIIEQKDTQMFFQKCIPLIFSYLHSKMKPVQFTHLKQSCLLNEFLLVKTGVFGKNIFSKFYRGLEFKSTDIKAQQNSQYLQKMQLRKNLHQLCSAQLQSHESPYVILNKIMQLVHSHTSWGIHIEMILCIDQENQGRVQNNLLIISHMGLAIKVNSSFARNHNNSVKSILNKNNQSVQQKIMHTMNYQDLELHTYGSILTILHKTQQEQKLYNIFSVHPFFLSSIIKFYKIIGEKYPVEQLTMKKSKIKEKFALQKKLQLPRRQFQQRSKSYMAKLDENIKMMFEEQRKTSNLQRKLFFTKVKSQNIQSI